MAGIDYIARANTVLKHGYGEFTTQEGAKARTQRSILSECPTNQLKRLQKQMIHSQQKTS